MQYKFSLYRYRTILLSFYTRKILYRIFSGKSIKRTLISEPLQFNKVLHIGAHLGQEFEIYRKYSVKEIVWVEADPSIYRELITSEVFKSTEIINTFANYFVTNDLNHETSLYRYSNKGASNSKYLPTKKFKQIWNYVENTGEVVNSKNITLEKLIEEIFIPSHNDLLVIDAQGEELNILLSGLNYLKCFDRIRVEISYVRIYQNGSTAKSVIKLLHDNGFILMNPWQSFHFDAEFIRVN